METRMLAHEHARTLADIAMWTNGLIGEEVPGLPGYQILRVVDFQVLTQREDYAALLLVEVEQRSGENLLELKEADIVAIEKITATIDDMPEDEIIPPEEELA